MDWPTYLRKVVSTTAGAAAGVAASAGGPIAVVSANATVGKLSDDLLAQFLGAHADQMQRIEELSQEIHGQLIKLQDTVGALLDAPWRTALAHIDEASRRPGHQAHELELARANLFEAWGVAEGLLERDARSQDPAALRCPLIAQQLAALYSFLGEPLNTVHWLVAAYTANRNLVNSQVDAIYDVLVQKVKRARKPSLTVSAYYSALYIRVESTEPKSTDQLWIRAPGGASPPGHKVRSAGRLLWTKRAEAQRDLEFEGRVAALVALDAEAQLLRQTCLKAGANEAALPSESAQKGARRAATVVGPNTGKSKGEMLDVIVVFNSTTAVLLTFFGSSARRRIDDRYREIWQHELMHYFVS